MPRSGALVNRNCFACQGNPVADQVNRCYPWGDFAARDRHGDVPVGAATAWNPAIDMAEGFARERHEGLHDRPGIVGVAEKAAQLQLHIAARGYTTAGPHDVKVDFRMDVASSCPCANL